MNMRDTAFVLVACAYIFLSCAWIGVANYSVINNQEVNTYENRVWDQEKGKSNAEKETGQDSYRIAMEMRHNLDIFVKTCPVFIETIPTNLEEYSCIMYATQSIGRYYITAYNDEETHCKVTASGGKVHEGTITTCAADPRYHKFGEVLEIDGRLYVVEDTGSAVKKRHIDIFFDDYKKMAQYGSNYQIIYKVTFPFGKPK